MSVAVGLPASVAISMVGVFLLMNALLGSRYGRWTAKSQQCSHIHRFCAKPQDHAYFIVFIVHFHLYNWEDVPVFVFDLCDRSWTIGLWVESKRSNLRAHFAGVGVPKDSCQAFAWRSPSRQVMKMETDYYNILQLPQPLTLRQGI